jgi:hypothetical protein
MTNSHKDCFSKSSLHVCQGQTDQLPIHFLYTPHPSFQLHHYSNSLLPVSLHPGNIASLNRCQHTLQSSVRCAISLALPLRTRTHIVSPRPKVSEPIRKRSSTVKSQELQLACEPRTLKSSCRQSTQNYIRHRKNQPGSDVRRSILKTAPRRLELVHTGAQFSVIATPPTRALS